VKAICDLDNRMAEQSVVSYAADIDLAQPANGLCRIRRVRGQFRHRPMTERAALVPDGAPERHRFTAPRANVPQGAQERVHARAVTA
jgi:hypothetical protein